MRTLPSRTPTTVRPDTQARHVRKYASRNPAQRWVLHRFFARIWKEIQRIAPRQILDFGCGEAFFWQQLSQFGPVHNVVGIDIRPEAIEAARTLVPEATFAAVDLFAFQTTAAPFDLVIASEVLEHLYDPEIYMQRLCELSAGYLLLTVPHEPYFRLCNLMRGRDILRLGNHPEHVQQWSARSFHQFVRQFADIERFITSFPFLIVVAAPHAVLHAARDFQQPPVGSSVR